MFFLINILIAKLIAIKLCNRFTAVKWVHFLEYMYTKDYYLYLTYTRQHNGSLISIIVTFQFSYFLLVMPKCDPAGRHCNSTLLTRLNSTFSGLLCRFM